MKTVTSPTKFSTPLLFLVSFVSIHWLAVLSNDFQNGPILCPVRLFFGYPCPMCGLTRSLGALSRGQILKSLHFNPFGIVFSFCAFIWVARPQWVSRTLKNWWLRFRSLTKLHQVIIIISLYTLLWALNILRVSTSFYSH
jgi:hypothetical protein